MKFITKYNEKEKDFMYILDDEGVRYNLSRIISLPKIADTFNSFQYTKDSVFVSKFIDNKKGIINSLPDSVKELIWRFGNYNNIGSKNKNYSEFSYAAVAFFMEDDISGNMFRTIIYDFNRVNIGTKRMLKIVLANNFIISTARYCGISDIDHPTNNKIYTEYFIHDLSGKQIFYNIVSSWFDYDLSSLEDYCSLDCNNPVYHHNVLLVNMANSDTDFVNISQSINIVMDTDNMCSVVVSDIKRNINKVLHCFDDIENSTDPFIVDSETILNTKVYDIFGNIHTFDEMKNVLMTQMKRR